MQPRRIRLRLPVPIRIVQPLAGGRRAGVQRPEVQTLEFGKLGAAGIYGLQGLDREDARANDASVFGWGLERDR